MVDLAAFGIDLKNERCDRPWAYAEAMLLKVSRTFALTINVLPSAPRRSVLLAYLFCRVADTVEDDPALSGEEKRDLLAKFDAIFLPNADWTRAAIEFAAALPEEWRNSDDDAKFLSAHPRWPLGLFFDLPASTVAHVSACVREMQRGMGEFALRQTVPGEWGGLKTVAELDRYCYFVAGIVGVMLTELFVEYTPLIADSTADALRARAIDFGEGLQLVNIVKDAAEDSLRGVSYVPEELCAAAGLTPKTLFAPENAEAAMGVMRALCEKALGHLDRAFEYSLLLPRLEPRLRLFCLWALLMAVATLERVTRDAQVLGEKKVKITRAEVKAIVRGSSLRVWSDALLKRQYGKLRARTVRNLEAAR